MTRFVCELCKARGEYATLQFFCFNLRGHKQHSTEAKENLILLALVIYVRKRTFYYPVNYLALLQKVKYRRVLLAVLIKIYLKS